MGDLYEFEVVNGHSLLFIFANFSFVVRVFHKIVLVYVLLEE